MVELYNIIMCTFIAKMDPVASIENDIRSVIRETKDGFVGLCSSK